MGPAWTGVAHRARQSLGAPIGVAAGVSAGLAWGVGGIASTAVVVLASIGVGIVVGAIPGERKVDGELANQMCAASKSDPSCRLTHSNSGSCWSSWPSLHNHERNSDCPNKWKRRWLDRQSRRVDLHPTSLFVPELL